VSIVKLIVSADDTADTESAQYYFCGFNQQLLGNPALLKSLKIYMFVV